MLSTVPPKFSLAQAMFLEVVVIAVGLVLYTLFPFFQFYFSGPEEFGFSEGSKLVENGLYFLGLVYLALIPPVFLDYQKKGRTPKSTIVFGKLLEKRFDREFWFVFRVYALKFLFIPLMYLGAIYFGEIAVAHLLGVLDTDTTSWTLVMWINHYIFPAFLNSAMTIVLIVYAFGYCVDSDRMNNKIKSVDKSGFSWAVTIICYAPFYAFVFYLIPNASQEYAFFKNEHITAWVRIVIMLIVAAKTWAILTLGTKSSNLTNRGIVTKGLYRWIRHPHYLTKIMIWWIGVLPSLVHAYWLIGGMIFWTTIYVLRALTEEQHLKKDPAYQAYMKEVKWRFIPGVF